MPERASARWAALVTHRPPIPGMGHRPENWGSTRSRRVCSAVGGIPSPRPGVHPPSTAPVYMADVVTRLDDPGRRTSGAGTAGWRRCPTCGNQYPGDFKVCPKDTTPLERIAAGDEDPMIGEVLAGS